MLCLLAYEMLLQYSSDCMMQQVLAGLNPEEGVPFASVYIDDILIFSQSFEDHLQHLEAVIDRVAAAGLRLKPSKCKFIRQTVEYLGHVLTPMGILEPCNSFQGPQV